MKIAEQRMSGLESTGPGRGFTLVEILLVLVVVGILASLAIPSMGRSFSRMELEGAADDMLFLMRYAQGRAVTKQVTVFLLFDWTAKQYWLEEKMSDSEPLRENTVGGKIAGRFGRKQNIPEGFSVDVSEPQIAFTPDGDISKARIQFCREEECRTISSREQPGYLQVWEGKSDIR